MKYSPLWDLSTVPSDLLHQEVGRRRRAAGPAATYLKMRPCDNCKAPLNATERRKPCPECGHKHPRQGSLGM